MDTDHMDYKNSNTTAIAAAIGSSNETGYWMRNEDGLRTPQQHPLARERASRLIARPSLGAGFCMASEALARAVRFTVNPHPRAPVPEATDTTDAELFDLPVVRDTEICWRRLVLRQLLCSQAAYLQVLFTEVVDLEPRRDSGARSSTETSTKREITRTELLLRTKLSPGKSTRNQQGLIPASECRHREIVRRGGKTFWFTCKGCNTRWPREQDEHLEAD